MKNRSALLHHNDFEMLMPMQKKNVLLRFDVPVLIEKQAERIGLLFKLRILLQFLRIGHGHFNSRNIQLFLHKIRRDFAANELYTCIAELTINQYWSGTQDEGYS
ncbi:hypothetical protein D3C75_1057920 [compost metagenome]